MRRPERGEIWLVRFPFTDLTTTKLRPALVLAVHGEDVIVMGIFSRNSEPFLKNRINAYKAIDGKLLKVTYSRKDDLIEVVTAVWKGE
ncbi:MAG: hypothetical protein WCA08_04405 [Desulfoferrobacter sp.]